MAPEVEARILELRRTHPGWGPRTIGHRLVGEGIEPVPGRSSIHRCLLRHGLITVEARRKRRSDYKRWERPRAMELWQMDIVGGVILTGEREAKIVTGVDDHSRFCVSAHVVARAIARPTCDALALAMRRHGVPDQVLTDNGKVFTGRFGPGALRPDMQGERHQTPAHRPPLTDDDGQGGELPQACDVSSSPARSSPPSGRPRPPRCLGDPLQPRAPSPEHGHGRPFERFRLAAPEPVEVDVAATPEVEPTLSATTRRVGANGLISFAAAKYRAGVWLAGQDVTVVCDGGLVHLQHRGVLVATHARRHSIDKQAAGLRRADPATRSVRRPSPTAASVTRKVDSSGNVCFAGASYRAGSHYRRRQVQVAVVGDMVEISIGNELIRCYPAKPDRTREHGALANPGGRPRRINAA